MSSKLFNTYGWYSTASGYETQFQRERRITKDWIRTHLPTHAQPIWLSLMDSYSPNQTQKEALLRISQNDLSELVALLYPRFPGMFHTALQHSLSPTLFPSIWEQPMPYSEELLTKCCHARTACLDASCLFALTGAVSCLEALLEHGADPDGLETPGSWSYIELPHNRILPVTPMDCALLSDNEDCQMVLELYGGKPLHEHLDPDIWAEGSVRSLHRTPL